MLSPVALFVIVSVPIISAFGISAYYFVIYRRNRTRSCSEASDHALPLQLPSSQKRSVTTTFRLDDVFLSSPLTFPPRARRRSSSSPPLFRSSASYVILSSSHLPPAAAPKERQIAGTDRPPSPHYALPADYDSEDDASLYLHYWPQTPSTASQTSNAFSPASSPDNSALLSYYRHGMRQAALTGIRRTTQTPTLDFGSLPTFDVTSPPHLGIGPPKTAPLPRPKSSSSSSTLMATPLASRSPSYENPFANPTLPVPPPISAPAQLDYFNCKPLPAPQHPYRCKVSSPLCHSPYSYAVRDQQQQQQPHHSSSQQARSYFSPAVTPAPLQVLTRPSSPVLSPFIPPTPDDDPTNLFPYISYESSSSPAAIVPLPTPPPSSNPTTASFSTPSAKTSNILDVKIYFTATQDLVKIRLPKQASLEDLKSKAAERITGGWKALWVAKAGVDTREPSGVARLDLDELDGERQWRSWLEAAARAGGSGSGKQSRIVLWAV